MTSTDAAGDRDRIRALVRRINAGWTQGRFDDLRPLLHDGFATANPGFTARVEGPEAFIESYRDFMSQATVRHFHEDDAVVDVCGNTATATFRWEISYDLDGTSYDDVGYDLFVFTREDGEWLAAWRTLVPLPYPVPEG